MLLFYPLGSAVERCDIKVNIDDGFLNLMSQDGASKDDVRVPEGDLGSQISTAFDEGKDLLVTIVSAMAEEQVSLARSHWLCALLIFVGYFVQGSPERLLDLTLAHVIVISRHSLVNVHFTSLHLTSLRMSSCCACTFHSLIRRVYCIVLSFGVATSSCMD